MIFLGGRFCAQNGQLDSAQTHKNTWFGDHLCTKGCLQKSMQVSRIVPKLLVFSGLFANFGGHLLCQNGFCDANVGVSLAVSNVLSALLCAPFLDHVGPVGSSAGQLWQKLEAGEV